MPDDIEDFETEALVIRLTPTTGSWVAPGDRVKSMTFNMAEKDSRGYVPPREKNFIRAIEVAAFNRQVFFYFEPEEGCSASGLRINDSTMDELAALWCRARGIDPKEYTRKTQS